MNWILSSMQRLTITMYNFYSFGMQRLITTDIIFYHCDVDSYTADIIFYHCYVDNYTAGAVVVGVLAVGVATFIGAPFVVLIAAINLVSCSLVI